MRALPRTNTLPPRLISFRPLIKRGTRSKPSFNWLEMEKKRYKALRMRRWCKFGVSSNRHYHGYQPPLPTIDLRGPQSLRSPRPRAISGAQRCTPLLSLGPTPALDNGCRKAYVLNYVPKLILCISIFQVSALLMMGMRNVSTAACGDTSGAGADAL
jgi:hypothetical protein